MSVVSGPADDRAETQPLRGFFGKLPSRGDYLQAGLPQTFVEPWNAWLQHCLSDARNRLGDSWTLCWLEAPVWRFALGPGVCGPNAVLGVWVPSVDRVGRDYPLMVAAVADRAPRLLAGSAWLDTVEAAACDAVLDTDEPDQLRRALPPFPQTGAAALPDPGAGAIWWTAGAPRVPPVRLVTTLMPGPAIFASMLEAIEVA